MSYAPRHKVVTKLNLWVNADKLRKKNLLQAECFDALRMYADKMIFVLQKPDEFKEFVCVIMCLPVSIYCMQCVSHGICDVHVYTSRCSASWSVV